MRLLGPESRDRARGHPVQRADSRLKRIDQVRCSGDEKENKMLGKPVLTVGSADSLDLCARFDSLLGRMNFWLQHGLWSKITL